MTDDIPGEDYYGVGTWVLADEVDGEWHRSLMFDGYEHRMACKVTLAAPTDIAGVYLRLHDLPPGAATDPGADVCSECAAFWEAEKAAGETTPDHEANGWRTKFIYTVTLDDDDLCRLRKGGGFTTTYNAGSTEPYVVPRIEFHVTTDNDGDGDYRIDEVLE